VGSKGIKRASFRTGPKNKGTLHTREKIEEGSVDPEGALKAQARCQRIDDDIGTAI